VTCWSSAAAYPSACIVGYCRNVYLNRCFSDFGCLSVVDLRIDMVVVLFILFTFRCRQHVSYLRQTYLIKPALQYNKPRSEWQWVRMTRNALSESAWDFSHFSCDNCRKSEINDNTDYAFLRHYNHIKLGLKRSTDNIASTRLASGGDCTYWVWEAVTSYFLQTNWSNVSTSQVVHTHVL